ncbi:MAG TPA: hypothetical protein VFS30_02220 [Dehalococcoidia bacterium]|nr:hypothetical protein [Dehalococcoidia bacterium]
MTTGPDLSRGLSRRSFIKVGTMGIAAGAFLVACGGDDDDSGSSSGSSGNGAPTSVPEATATTAAEAPSGGNELSLVAGWYRDAEVKYYDFGANTPLAEGNSIATAPIYAFITGMDADGNPQFVEGQHNIVAVKPGDDGYSDLWRVNLVTVDDAYEADSVKAVADVMSGGFAVTETDIFVNCPIVETGTTLEGGEALTQGWLNGEEAFYPDFGPNAPVAIPIWAFITGMDADGNPEFVEGQMNIIDSVPDDVGYSAFWRVNLVTVGDDYEANTYTSADAVRAAGMETAQTDIVVNCPVTVF